MERLRVGEPAVGHPELLVVAHRLDNQRVAVPAPDGRAVVAEHELGRLRERAAVRVDDAPVAVAAAVEHEDAPELALLDELDAVGHLELARSPRRDAARQRIIAKTRTL